MQMLPQDRQAALERIYSKKHVDRLLLVDLLESPLIVEKIAEGVKLLEDWLAGEYYEQKMQRLAQLTDLDLEHVTQQVFVQSVYCQVPELFTSFTAKIAGILQFDDKPSAIQTMAEIVAVLCNTDVFDINKASRSDSMMVQSNITPSERLMQYVDNAVFTPPMVCEPKPLRGNYDSGYMTFNESLVLGAGNHHDGDIALDVLNIQNRVPLTLNIEFLKSMEECPNKPITPENVYQSALKKGNMLSKFEARRMAADQQMNWESFVAQSRKVYLMLYKQGNRFHLTNKVDKRGRLYSVGYHVHTQGSAYKKAMVELANTEVVEGVPA